MSDIASSDGQIDSNLTDHIANEHNSSKRSDESIESPTNHIEEIPFTDNDQTGLKEPLEKYSVEIDENQSQSREESNENIEKEEKEEEEDKEEKEEKKATCDDRDVNDNLINEIQNDIDRSRGDRENKPIGIDVETVRTLEKAADMRSDEMASETDTFIDILGNGLLTKRGLEEQLEENSVEIDGNQSQSREERDRKAEPNENNEKEEKEATCDNRDVNDNVIHEIQSDIDRSRGDRENKSIGIDVETMRALEKAADMRSDEIASETDTFIDILGNGLLTKRIIVNGLGRETRPTHGDSVTIQYRAWNSSDVLFEEKEVSFVLGDGDMIQAFDLGICLAERHEEFELKTDARFAYGCHGWEPHVQPNEALTFRIKLLRVDDPPDFSTFSHADRMTAADAKRERGNYLFRREEYSLAVNSYSRAIKIIQTDPDYKKASTDPSKGDMYDLFVKVTNNLAAAQLKLEIYDNVIETCNTILTYDPSNVKALFRKGKSLTVKGNYDEAIPILKKALDLENSKLIAQELQRCYQLKRSEDEQRARVCRKMFGTETKNVSEKCKATTISTWKQTVYRYSPYIGAILVTGISVMLASIAIAKSKDN